MNTVAICFACIVPRWCFILKKLTFSPPKSSWLIWCIMHVYYWHDYHIVYTKWVSIVTFIWATYTSTAWASSPSPSWTYLLFSWLMFLCCLYVCRLLFLCCCRDFTSSSCFFMSSLWLMDHLINLFLSLLDSSCRYRNHRYKHYILSGT